MPSHGLYKSTREQSSQRKAALCIEDSWLEMNANLSRCMTILAADQQDKSNFLCACVSCADKDNYRSLADGPSTEKIIFVWLWPVVWSVCFHCFLLIWICPWSKHKVAAQLFTIKLTSSTHKWQTIIRNTDALFTLSWLVIYCVTESFSALHTQRCVSFTKNLNIYFDLFFLHFPYICKERSTLNRFVDVRWMWLASPLIMCYSCTAAS